MRLVKRKEDAPILEDVVKRFLLVKEAQHTGEEAIREQCSCSSRVIASNHDFDIVG